MTTDQNKLVLPAKAEMILRNQKLSFNNFESIVAFARGVLKGSINYKELTNFERSLGIHDEDHCEYQACKCIDEISVESLGDSITSKPLCIELKNLCILDFCNASNRTLIYAPSNAGKSFFLLDMAIAIASGRPSMFF